MHHYCTKVSARGTANYNLFVERVNQHLVEVAATGWKLIDTNWAARDTELLLFWAHDGTTNPPN